MLKKFVLACCLCVLPVAMIGCGGSVDDMADKAKETVEGAADTAKEKAGEMAPEGTKDAVEGAIDKGEEAAKDGIDAAAGAAGGN